MNLFFAFITEGGYIKAAMKAENSISTDSRGGALIYLYFVVFKRLAYSMVSGCIFTVDGP